MVKQQEEKLQAKERELMKREQEVNEKIARMVSDTLNLTMNNVHFAITIEVLHLRKCFPYVDKCRGIQRYSSNSKYYTSPTTFTSSSCDKLDEAIMVIWP